MPELMSSQKIWGKKPAAVKIQNKIKGEVKCRRDFRCKRWNEAIRKQLGEAQQLMHTTCCRLPTRENTTVTQFNVSLEHQCVRCSDRTAVDFLKAKLGA